MGEVPGGRLTGVPVHLARLSAARRARQVLRAAEDAAATAVIELGASYPTIADAADTAGRPRGSCTGPGEGGPGPGRSEAARARWPGPLNAARAARSIPR